MSTYEYDEEATRRAIRDNAYEKGLEDGIERGRQEGESKGRINSILQLPEETASVPEKMREEILAEKNEET